MSSVMSWNHPQKGSTSEQKALKIVMLILVCSDSGSFHDLKTDVTGQTESEELLRSILGKPQETMWNRRRNSQLGISICFARS